MVAVFVPIGLTGLVLFGLWAWAVLDVISTDAMLCRNIPKGTWIFLVVFVPTLGAIAWLVLGRPEGANASLGGQRSGYENNPHRSTARGYEDSAQWQASVSRGTPDTSDLAANINESQAVKERRLLEWEAELAKREAALADESEIDPDDSQPGSV